MPSDGAGRWTPPSLAELWSGLPERLRTRLPDKICLTAIPSEHRFRVVSNIVWALRVRPSDAEGKVIDSRLSAWMHDTVDSFLDLKLVSLEVYLPRRLDVRPGADDAFAAALRLFEDELYPTILDETESMRFDPRFGLHVVMRYSRNGRSSVRAIGSDDCELVADAACARFFSALAPWLGDLSEATFSFHEAQRRSAHERLRARHLRRRTMERPGIPSGSGF